jgi:hypothetical protein
MARLLLFFAVHPDEALHIRELYRRTGLGMASLQKELDRLHRLEIIQQRADGRKVVYRLELAGERWRAVRALVRIAGSRRHASRQRRRPVPGGGRARRPRRTGPDLRSGIADRPRCGRDHVLVRRIAREDASFLARVSREPKQWIAGDPRTWSELEAYALTRGCSSWSKAAISEPRTHNREMVVRMIEGSVS